MSNLSPPIVSRVMRESGEDEAPRRAGPAMRRRQTCRPMKTFARDPRLLVRPPSDFVLADRGERAARDFNCDSRCSLAWPSISSALPDSIASDSPFPATSGGCFESAAWGGVDVESSFASGLGAAGAGVSGGILDGHSSFSETRRAMLARVC